MVGVFLFCFLKKSLPQEKGKFERIIETSAVTVWS